MDSPYSAKCIAAFFLDHAEQYGEILTPMKIQKLVYFAHGWCLGLIGEPLIDESVHAWRYGPIIPTIYYEFREFGRDPIRNWKRDMETRIELFKLYKDTSTIRFLSKIWEIYGGFTALRLAEITHLPDAPYTQVRKKSKKPEFVISDSIIEKYFKEKLEAVPAA